jgi:hypothetical protein
MQGNPKKLPGTFEGIYTGRIGAAKNFVPA